MSVAVLKYCKLVGDEEEEEEGKKSEAKRKVTKDSILRVSRVIGFY
jgi:hypothetical protein